MEEIPNNHLEIKKSSQIMWFSTTFPSNWWVWSRISRCFFNRKISHRNPSRRGTLTLAFTLLFCVIYVISGDGCFFRSFFFSEKGYGWLSMKRYIYIYFCVSRCLQCRMKRRLILVCSVRWDVRYFKRTGAWRRWCVHADMCSFFSCSLALICFLLSLFLFAWLVCFCTHHYASHSWMYLLYYYIYI